MTIPTTTKPPPSTTRTYKPAPPAYHQLPLSQDPPSYTVALSRTLSRPYIVASPAPASASTSSMTKPGVGRRSSGLFSSSSSGSTSKSSSSTNSGSSSESPLVDPETFLPPTFKIGLRYTRPLITLPEVKDHLKVLSGIDESLARIKGDAMRLIEEGQLAARAKARKGEVDEADNDEGQEGEKNVITPDVAVAAYLTLSAWEFDGWVRDLYQRYYPTGTSNAPTTNTGTPAGVVDPTVTPFGATRVRGSSDPGSTRVAREEDGQEGGWRIGDLPKSWGVVMIWHAYCLNPRWYKDDLKNREELRVLNRAGGFPFRLISRYIDPDTLEYRPPGVDKPVPVPTVDQLRSTRIHINCPFCSIPIDVALISPAPALDGYAQKAFKMVCPEPECRAEADHELLKVVKFIKDLRRIVSGEMETLPGMLLRPSNGLEDVTRPRLFSQLVARMFIDSFDRDVKLFPIRVNGKLDPDRTKMSVFKNFYGYHKSVEPYTQDELHREASYGHGIPSVKRIIDAQAPDYTMFTVTAPTQMKYYHDALKAAIDDGRFKTWVAGFRLVGDEAPRRFGKMWSAYTSAGLASLDLGEATARQSGFIGKMKEMGWLERGKFDGTERLFLLQKSVARYHAFLDLMSSVPSGFLCPTLDIDLAWHTHQLKHDAYRAETTTFIRRFVDHDDKVSESRLGDAYSYTAKHWLKRFGVPYSACGCHQGDGLVGLLDPSFGLPSKLKFWNKNKEPTRKDVTLTMEGEMGEEERDITHPSTHNIVRIRGMDEEESRRQSRMLDDSERDRPADSKTTPKDPEKAALAAIFRKKPQHRDPFLYTSSREYVDNVDFRARYDIGSEGARGNSKLYWGVSAGAGVVIIGGGVMWGMTTDDCQNVDADQLQGRAGACAVGAGPTAGGFCGAGGTASCASAACAGTAGGGSCAGGGGGGASCGGGGGASCGGGGGGGCGGGGS